MEKREIIMTLAAALEDDGYTSEDKYEDAMIDELMHERDRLWNAVSHVLTALDERKSVPINGTVYPVRQTQDSFDHSFAGQYDDDLHLYWCLCRDYKTHEAYAIRYENSIRFIEGRTLQEGDAPREICGHLVRPMTVGEAEKWNRDELLEVVDCFGNVSVDEPFDMEWYMENCL